MKSLNEYLVLELKADTYKSAYQKAKGKGDERAREFLKAYIDALEKETPEADERTKQITDWSKEDKPLIRKIRKFCHSNGEDGDDLTYAPDGFMKNYISFNICNYYHDEFFFRFGKRMKDTMAIGTPNAILDTVFTDEFQKDNDDKKFMIIDGRGAHHNYYLYNINDKKLQFISKGFGTKLKEEKDITEFVKNTIKKIGI